jgi:hypothetical protein
MTQDEFKAAAPEAYYRLIRDDFRGVGLASPAELAAAYRAQAILAACISEPGGWYSDGALKHALDGLRLYEDDRDDGGSPVLPIEDLIVA